MRKRFIIILILLALLLTSCGFMAVDDDSIVSIGIRSMFTAHGEAESHTFAEIQERLAELGFYDGKCDGIIGKKTKAAIIEFQYSCGLDGTGEIDEMTEKLLFTEAPLPTPTPVPLKIGDEDGEDSTQIRSIQTRLVVLGYLSIEPDGVFGDDTETALKEFQSANGLNPTGEANTNTMTALFSASAVVKPTPAPTPLAKGASGEDVTALQEALRVMGFMSGEADGSFGSETTEAVKRYQRAVNANTAEEIELENAVPLPTPTPSPAPAPIVENEKFELRVIGTIEPEPTPEPTPEPFTPTDTVDDDLMNDILAYRNVVNYNTDLSEGSSGDDVERIQRRLTTLDYLYNGVDGDYGANTVEAVKLFQKVNSLPQTGIADKTTQVLLFSESALKSAYPYHMYYLKVSTDEQRVYAYEWDPETETYSKLVRTMICSTGKNATPTPKGIFKAGGPTRGQWYYFKDFNCYAQYGYVIKGGIMFHSVIYSRADEKTLHKSSVNALGKKASHGCVRLKVEDAKWIYDNCKAGTTVEIY